MEWSYEPWSDCVGFGSDLGFFTYLSQVQISLGITKVLSIMVWGYAKNLLVPMCAGHRNSCMLTHYVMKYLLYLAPIYSNCL